MRTLSYSLLSLILILFISCEKEETSITTTTNLPATYDFENVDYSGQETRLDMLSEVVTYMKTANSGAEISSVQLQDMFSNTNHTWLQTDLNGSTKQLANKIADGEQNTFGLYFASLEASSQSKLNGSNGVAGLVSSNSGTKTYLFDENGHEPLQFIEKVSMSAIFINQITQVYMGADKMNVDNETVEPGKGTEMQHHWDEAFGYWGVPVEFGTNGFTYTSGEAYDRFWAKYTNSRDALLNCNAKLMKAYIKGRDAIDRKDYTTRDLAIEEVQLLFANIQAATAIHYLNSANANLADDALRNHALSEALAFAYGLRFNAKKMITEAEFQSLFGSGAFDNFYDISTTEIITARDGLAEAYGFADIKESL
jgi:hypothetical protein